jgi:hypothetical protein
MSDSTRSRVRAPFAVPQNKDDKALNHRENTRQPQAEHATSLRAHRPAKEAADKDAAGKMAVKNWKPSRSPHGH